MPTRIIYSVKVSMTLVAELTGFFLCKSLAMHRKSAIYDW
jgi:hypothetical protein